MIHMFKVNRYTCRESDSFILIIASLLSGGRHLKVRICSSRSKFFPVSVDSYFVGFVMRRRTKEVKKVCPLQKMEETHCGMLIHLKLPAV